MRPAGQLAPPAAEHGAPDPEGRARVYLHAGQLSAPAWPAQITTVLGSCVAVCLFDAEVRVGGMNHYLLAQPVNGEHSARFGAVAVPALIDAVVKGGGRPGSLKAKVFGGAAVTSASGRRSLGAENAALALHLLTAAGIPVLQTDLGGQRGRKLIFHTDDGSAWVRQL
ncbi:MAG: chemotaxis protein CheD [Anaeromyxobacter sp.]